jgi:hypothetical protein
MYDTPDKGSGGGGDGGNTSGGGANQNPAGDNNAGQEDDLPLDLWNVSTETATSTGSAAATSTGGGGGDSLTALDQTLTSLSFGDGISQDMLTAAINSGDVKDLNAAIATQIRQGLRTSVIMAAKMMAGMQGKMKDEFQGMIHGNLSASKAETTLFEAFPGLKDKPDLTPVVKGIFTQLLKHPKTGGDVTRAVAATKKYMGRMMGAAAADLGVRMTPPGTPGRGGIVSPEEFVTGGGGEGDNIDWGDILGMGPKKK